MKCARCDRVLIRPPAVVILTKNGPLAWGPVCSKYVVVKPTRTPLSVLGVRPREPRKMPVDPAQLVLELETVDG